MIAVAIGFASAGLLLLTLGLLIRKGRTWLIAGYDPSRVRDEKGLASWAGKCVMSIGAVGLLAGGLVYALPEAYAFIPVIAYFAAIVGGVITAVIGTQRFMK
jgi:hypothetical protein